MVSRDAQRSAFFVREDALRCASRLTGDSATHWSFGRLADPHRFDRQHSPVLPTPLDDTLYARDGVADFVAGVDKHRFFFGYVADDFVNNVKVW